MTLTKKLYKSRKYQGPSKGFTYESEMVDLIREIEQAAQAQGLNVSRWQNNSNSASNVVETITWAVHTGGRPAMSRNLPDDALVVVLDNVEGTTARCEAHRELSILLNDLLAIAFTEKMDRAGVYAPNKQSGWLKCPVCRNEFYWTEKCFETDDGDLCERCTAAMRAEQDQEVEYQAQGLA